MNCEALPGSGVSVFYNFRLINSGLFASPIPAVSTSFLI